MAEWRERGILGAVAALGGAVLLTASVVLAAGPGNARAPVADDGPGTELKFQGWVRSVSGRGEDEDRLAVVTANGTFEVLVDEETKVLDSENGQPMERGQLAVAQPVDVQGEVDDAAQVRAQTITVGTIRPTLAVQEMSLRGRLLALFAPSPVTGERQIMVLVGSRGESRLEVDRATLLVDSKGNPVKFGDLKAGQSVLVEALGTHQDVGRALRVEVVLDGQAPQVTVDGILLARGQRPDGHWRWIVGEYLVIVPRELAGGDNGAIALISQVSITAQRQAAFDGELVATRIRPVARAARPMVVDLRGRVERWANGTLVVDGNVLKVPTDSAVPGNLAAGMFVKVRAELDGSGGLRAISVEEIKPGRIEVQFEGSILSVEGELWKVAGWPVLTGLAVITGDQPAIGAHAEVAGLQLPTGEVQALRITVLASVQPTSAPVLGTLTEHAPPPAVWKVRDRNEVVTEVLVSEDTLINENSAVAGVGALVEVKGRRNGNNQIEALRVRVLRSAK